MSRAHSIASRALQETAAHLANEVTALKNHPSDYERQLLAGKLADLALQLSEALRRYGRGDYENAVRCLMVES